MMEDSVFQAPIHNYIVLSDFESYKHYRNVQCSKEATLAWINSLEIGVPLGTVGDEL
jgi:hypothetical protein